MEMNYKLYQRKPGRESFRELPVNDIDMDDYHMTAEGDVSNASNEDEALEKIFQIFNRDDRPTAKISYSMSVNDIVELDNKRFVCAFVGWTLLSNEKSIPKGDA